MTIHVIAMSATTDDSRKWPRAAGDRHGQGTRVGSLAGPCLPYRPAPLVDEPPATGLGNRGAGTTRTSLTTAIRLHFTRNRSTDRANG